ncbi:pentapeptide repeat-containing protein [Streptomyces sp. N2-109]|uniref:Pentapeptide repeat-containing protein n=1 Tax=Streptomyces gossypii TaxID=2883101 RepID=A0ABT2JQ61_9ACTN|nr:pentapeptide repeat-containing protein [Streptomyces gossypii]MCT2589654.1 pentapeptide repeat-containing protein [Streptomyces gossypii]
MADADREAYLAGLAPGADLDHCGTLFAGDLLRELIDAVRDPADEQPRIGHARFRGATFDADARFCGATFDGDAEFRGVTFIGIADFRDASFCDTDFGLAEFHAYVCFGGAAFFGHAWFKAAKFSKDADFKAAKFHSYVTFELAIFSSTAWFWDVAFSKIAGFGAAKFTGHAEFTHATFSDKAEFNMVTFLRAHFHGVTFSGSAQFISARFSESGWFKEARFRAETEFTDARSSHVGFDGATFEITSQVGPLVCRHLDLSGARFGAPVTIEAATDHCTCVRTRWESTAALRLRYTTVDLSDAVIEYPVSVAARATGFDGVLRPVDESALAERDPRVQVASVSGIDTAHLVLRDVDLSACRFTGAFHLDQLRLEGRCTFAAAPFGLHRRGIFPVRWTPRRTLAEEHHWRAATGAINWTPEPAGGTTAQPSALAPVYRQLRKSFEDGKNEPDAADFYYGEMEMRRHDGERPRAERTLLTLYWAVSGYGLRASRALACLLGAMAVTVLAMMLWGIPKDVPKPATTGHLTEQDISLTTDNAAPVNPSGPLRTRLTSERWEKSLRIVVNSVVFRSSGQDLTTTGIYTEMACRLTEPVLFGLAALAVRGRVKR